MKWQKRIDAREERQRPQWLAGAPYCSEECPSHDGKRCRLMGQRPDRICEPAVIAMADELQLVDRAAERKAHDVQWHGVFRGTDEDPREVGWCDTCGREVYDGDPQGHRQDVTDSVRGGGGAG